MHQRILTPYLNGAWQPRRRRAAEPVTDPYTGRRLAWLVAGDEADLEDAIAGAGRGARALAVMPRHRRAEILETVSSLLREEGDGLARLIARDAGKPLTLAAAEVSRACLLYTSPSPRD